MIPIKLDRPAAPTAPAARSSLRWLLAAPHRLFFFLGMIGLVLTSLWWLGHLAARSAGIALPGVLPPAWLHGWMMANGFLPLFMFGFLFTAGPKWLQVEPPPVRVMLVPGLLALAGLLLALAGAQFHATAVAAGAVLMAAGWLPLLVRFANLIRASRVADRRHARLVLAFFVCGVLALLMFALSLPVASSGGVHGALTVSVWLFLVPVYVTVAHRLLPFFVGSVLPHHPLWRPAWLLAALLGIVLGHGLLLLGAMWSSGAAFDLLRLALDAGGAVLILLLVWRWGLAPAMGIPLLAMLHLGLAWLGIAFALYAWNHAALLFDAPHAGLGLAPLHALAMGFFGTLMYGMVTRVTAGHGGRALRADGLDQALFWVLQAAVGVRMLADIWLAQASWLMLLAGVLWCAALLPWALGKSRIVLRPRLDGKPG